MKPRRPNFLFINTDQHRWDCFSIERRRQGLATPYLDHLAASGVRFGAAYSTCPICVPQRMSLMSGQLQSTHGVLTNNAAIYGWPVEHTLPGELKTAGYQTALMGRDMHLYPMEQRFGFDHQEICTAYPCAYTRFIAEHADPWQGGVFGGGAGVNSWNAAPWHLPDHLHYTHWTTEMSIRFLKGRDPQCPFFLVVGYNAPHCPLNPPRFYFDRYHRMADLGEPVYGDWAVPPPNDGLGQNPEGESHVHLQGEILRSCFAGYYGLINHIDAEVGRLLLYLRASGLAANTYVVFTSDHGEMLGDHYLFHKSRPYEGSAHIPLFISGPGIDGGGTCDRVVGWHDLMPTILELAGTDVPESVDGRSLLPLLRAPHTGEWRDYLHGEEVHRVAGPEDPPAANVVQEPGMHYVTDGREKLVWFPHSGREQFFDLSRDPDECRDLSSAPGSAERVRLWRDRLIATLANRPEGFSDGKRLIPGRRLLSRMPHAQAIVDSLQSGPSDYPRIIDALFP